MKLIDNVKCVLLKAWSVRLMALAGFFAGAEAALPFFTTVIPTNTMAILSAIASAGAIIARVVAQPDTLPK